MDILSASKFWDTTLNAEVSYENVPAGSNKDYYWSDELGHTWLLSKERILRLKNDNPCPYCNNRKPLAGYNDLQTLYPDVAKEWHPTKNEVSPTEVLARSTKKHWWLCNRGHEWETKLSLRTNQNTKCPTCSGKKIQTGFNDLATTHPHLIKEWGITNTIKITEIGAGSRKKANWVCGKGHRWEAAVMNRSRTKNPSGCPVCVNQQVAPGVNDLLTAHPELTDCWDYEKNTGNPNQLTASNKTIVWWKEPKCGHSYQLGVTNRAKAKNCQVCINRIVVPGVNDITAVSPELSSQWHPTRNTLLLTETTIGNSNKVWWLCDKGHEWKATPNDRSSYKTQCPYCANQKVLPGYNDLGTTHSHLLTEWHTKNVVQPEDVTAGADVKVWWQCKKGHAWEAAIYSRTSSKRAANCPLCSHREVMPGETDLVTLNPELALEWHPERNTISPDKVAPFSNKKAWWKCSDNHEWEAIIGNRQSGKGCPTCSTRISVSKNEKAIVTFLQEKGFTIIENDRKLLKGKELDIYIPSHKLAIEYNGLHWHTERYRDRNYHYEKWKACKEMGVQLITVWEDDYERNPNLVYRMLQHKLGETEQKRLYARRLHVTTVTNDDAKKFLEENHIQGYCNNTIFYSLLEGSTIVAVLGLRKVSKTQKEHYTLTRYATSENVIGGFSKLLKHAENQLKPRSITTYSDHHVSDGKLYANNGFENTKTLSPDYSYFDQKNRKRTHKFLYRLKRFRDDPSLSYVFGYTEKQLAEINKLPRIWDSGKERWVKSYDKI